MYKKTLFGNGAKSFLSFQHKRGSTYRGFGCCSYKSGSGSKMDNYLLGLVRNVSINSKPKKKGRGGGGLKFVR